MLSCHIRVLIIEVLNFWLATGGLIRDLLEDAELFDRMRDFVRDSRCDDLDTRTTQEQGIIRVIEDWWRAVVDQLFSISLKPRKDSGSAAGEHGDAKALPAQRASLYRSLETGEGVFKLLDKLGQLTLQGISPLVSRVSLFNLVCSLDMILMPCSL